MSGMPWFRLYAEIINDPKVGQLSDSEFRTFVELMCLACESGTDGNTNLTVSETEWKLRRNVSETIEKLLEVGLVTLNSAKRVIVKNYSKRQFKSDKSTDRVRKHREKHKKNNEVKNGNGSETLHETEEKQDVNALDTDTDTEKERKKEKSPSVDDLFEKFWTAAREHWFGPPGSKQEAKTQFKKLKPDELMTQRLIQALQDQADALRALKESDGFAANMKHVVRWLRIRCFDDEPVEQPKGQGCQPKSFPFAQARGDA